MWLWHKYDNVVSMAALHIKLKVVVEDQIMLVYRTVSALNPKLVQKAIFL